MAVCEMTLHVYLFVYIKSNISKSLTRNAHISSAISLSTRRPVGDKPVVLQATVDESAHQLARLVWKWGVDVT